MEAQSENNNPYWLELEPYHLSEIAARNLISSAILSAGHTSPAGGWNHSHWNVRGKQISYRELVSLARKTGVAYGLQDDIDRKDDIFGGKSFGISTPTMQLGQVTVEYLGITKTFYPPMTDQPVESEISSDIMFYRREACLFSDEYDFEMTTRYYRSYLSSCVSLVDAFINRHIIYYRCVGLHKKEMDDLEKIGRLLDRIEFFIEAIAKRQVTELNSGDEWADFCKLKGLRNEMTHINSPSLGYSIHDFPEHFNLVRKGVGGLLSKIRELQGKSSLGFVEHLKTAPKVYFNEITEKAGGRFIVKKRHQKK